VKPVPSSGTLPSLFCFSVTRATGSEPELLRKARGKKAGIFACDEHALFSTLPLILAPGEAAVHFDPARVGVSSDGTAANAKLFMHVWEVLLSSSNLLSKIKNHDWTVKVDPDALLLPDRLRWRLSPHSGWNVFVKDCSAWGTPLMFGAIEVLSKSAVLTYFEGKQSCDRQLQWQPWGEDKYLQNCLDFLHVGSVEDYSLVIDGYCAATGMLPNCTDAGAAAFHPLKSPTSWEACLSTAISAR
jgi:hypothetical protein